VSVTYNNKVDFSACRNRPLVAYGAGINGCRKYMSRASGAIIDGNYANLYFHHRLPMRRLRVD
jgi:hypothetical protein